MSRRPRLTEEQSKALREDSKAGMSNVELAKKYGVGLNTIHRHKIASPRRKQLTEFETRKARQMYKEGMPQARIAAHFGVSTSHIQVALKRNYFAI